MTYSFATFEVVTPNSEEAVHSQESTIFDLDLGFKVTGAVAQYPLHHVTFASAKFDGCSVQGDAFT